MFGEEKPLESAPPLLFSSSQSESNCLIEISIWGREGEGHSICPDDKVDGAPLGAECFKGHQLKISVTMPALFNIYSFIQAVFIEYLLYKALCKS